MNGPNEFGDATGPETLRADTGNERRAASPLADLPDQATADRASSVFDRSQREPGPAAPRKPIRMIRRALAELAEVRVLFWRERFLVALANRLPVYAFGRSRTMLLRMAGCRLERGSVFLGRVRLYGPRHAPARLSVGGGTVIAPDVTLGLDADITIGKNVNIGPGTTIYTGSHLLGDRTRRRGPGVFARPIVVEDGVWVAMSVLILPGVSLGAGCVVSAGAVVQKSVPPNVLVGGNPAKEIQSLPG